MQQKEGYVYDLSLVDTYVFDYGGVVSHHYCEPWQSNLSKLLNVDQKVVHDLLSETSPQGKDYRLGKMSRSQFWDEIMKLSGTSDVSIEDLANNWARSYQIDERMLNVIERLRSEKTFQVGVLMNSDEYRHKHIEKEYALSSKLDFLVSSFIHSVTKPDLEAYTTVLRLANRLDQPERVLYIDDREKNIVPSLQLGMQGYVYSSFEDFNSFLQMNNVLNMRNK